MPGAKISHELQQRTRFIFVLSLHKYIIDAIANERYNAAMLINWLLMSWNWLVLDSKSSLMKMYLGLITKIYS